MNKTLHEIPPQVTVMLDANKAIFHRLFFVLLLHRYDLRRA